jgi:hypothetical protein
MSEPRRSITRQFGFVFCVSLAVCACTRVCRLRGPAIYSLSIKHQPDQKMGSEWSFELQRRNFLVNYRL